MQPPLNLKFLLFMYLHNQNVKFLFESDRKYRNWWKIWKFILIGYPDLPTGIRVVKVSNSSAEVEFRAESVNIQQEVIINILNEADLSPFEVLFTVSSTERTQRAEIRSLQPKTEYSVSLKVCNIFGCNPKQTTPVIFETEGNILQTMFCSPWFP